MVPLLDGKLNWRGKIRTLVPLFGGKAVKMMQFVVDSGTDVHERLGNGEIEGNNGSFVRAAVTFLGSSLMNNRNVDLSTTIDGIFRCWTIEFRMFRGSGKKVTGF
ncbi:hypothetical protein D7Z54_29740 [Salibacterium salarium]|uniref:Uncharacterized protein n=1 Tax=Salibacterium salarium TaxID=284579 RepID=A0A428MU94_9BACI|nr:hypothetical protein [Salibacterium salarium]RSL29713.1 hypothetical protein D7Z54_29740 [Salibacterium salarium]